MKLADLQYGQVLSKEDYLELSEQLFERHCSISQQVISGDSEGWMTTLKTLHLSHRVESDNILNGGFVICQLSEEAKPYRADDGGVAWTYPEKSKMTFFIKSNKCL